MLAARQTLSDRAVWAALGAELDAWAATGRVATFWWRDDDATGPSPALDRLLALAEGIPLGLAVIPQPADPALAAHLEGTGVVVLQHGIVHENRASFGARSSEFPEGEAVEARLEALDVSRRRMATLFGDRFVPVLVPPWNRIAPALAARLGEAGFVGLSASGMGGATGGFPRIDIRIDPVDWRGSRRFRGVGPVTLDVIDHLRRRRTGLDPDVAIGILTHHRLDDPMTEAFMADFVGLVAHHPAASWCGVRRMFGL
jgi:hypothetical protein